MKQDEGKLRYQRAARRMDEILQKKPTKKAHLFKADDKRPPEGYEVVTFGGDFVPL